MPTCAFACAHTHHTHTTFKMHFRSSAPCCVHYGFFQFLLLGGEKHLRVGVMLQHPGGNRDSLRYQFLPSSLFEESLGFLFFFLFLWGLFPSSPKSVPLGLPWDWVFKPGPPVCIAALFPAEPSFQSHVTLTIKSQAFIPSGPHLVLVLRTGTGYLSLGDKPQRSRDHHWISQTARSLCP